MLSERAQNIFNYANALIAERAEDYNKQMPFEKAVEIEKALVKEMIESLDKDELINAFAEVVATLVLENKGYEIVVESLVDTISQLE